MSLRTIDRGGRYWRVCDPDWADPSDTSFSKRRGGRWNPAGLFGALYLCATLDVALANARRHIASLFGSIATLEDLRPQRRPDLQAYEIVAGSFVDVVTPEGIAAAGFPESFPVGISHGPCQEVARHARGCGCPGVASRSAVRTRGEELAIFDVAVDRLSRKREREPYAVWKRRVNGD